MNTTITKLGTSAYYPNMGTFDRNLRYLAGACLMASLLVNPQLSITVAVVMMLVTVPLVTSAIVRWDPVYDMLGINTRETGKTRQFVHDENVSKEDAVVRYAIGTSLIVIAMLGASVENPWLISLALVAIPVVITAMIKWDPVYAFFPGFSTIPLARSTASVIQAGFGPTENPDNSDPLNHAGSGRKAA